MSKSFFSLVLSVIGLVFTGCTAPASLQANSAHAAQPVAAYPQAAYGAGAPGAMPMAPSFYAPAGSHIMSLGTPIPGCETGALAVRVNNLTDEFLQLEVDGRSVELYGAEGPLPAFLPPRAQGFLCMDRPGFHRVTGQRAVVGRDGQLHPIINEPINWSGNIGAGYNGNTGHHDLYIRRFQVSLG